MDASNWSITPPLKYDPEWPGVAKGMSAGNIEGTLVGVYCPPYMAGLNAVGWHLHFISKDKTKGGHVLGVNLANAVLTWDDTDEFQMRLPQNEKFHRFDLAADQSDAIKRIETNKES